MDLTSFPKATIRMMLSDHMDPADVRDKVQNIADSSKRRWNDAGSSKFHSEVRKLNAILTDLQDVCTGLDDAVVKTTSDLDTRIRKC